jgi:hypothetical protein
VIQDVISDYEMARTCIARMREDLRSIYVVQKPEYSKPEFNDPPDLYRIVSKNDYEGEESFPELRFASHAHLVLDNSPVPEGVARIVYYVEESEDYGYVLKRSDSLYPYNRLEEEYIGYGEDFAKKNSDPVLCENVKSLVFKFIDQDKEEYESWNSESDEHKFSTPLIIEIELQIGDYTRTRIFETKIHLPVLRGKI